MFHPFSSLIFPSSNPEKIYARGFSYILSLTIHSFSSLFHLPDPRKLCGYILIVGYFLMTSTMKIQLSLSLSLALALTYLFFCKYAENSRTVTDKEWYFFCRRGRKYRNSVRPNRVTGSGFWKATGIDKPIYSVEEGHSRGDCIGLKKSLVYYCGSAGKGTKTDWMMHEFRLPADQKNATLPTAKAADQEAVRKKQFPNIHVPLNLPFPQNL